MEDSKRYLVYAVFSDDSERERNIQVVGCVVIPANCFRDVERDFGNIIQEELSKHPEIANHPKFEFHASEIWNQSGVWAGLPKESAERVFRSAVSSLNYIDRPCVTYGAIDISHYPDGQEGQRKRIRDAFELCCLGISQWFREFDPGAYGTLVFDEPEDKILKNDILETFRSLRPMIMSSPPSYGPLDCITDDMYFGDSKRSRGLQLADICSFIISKKLSGSRNRRNCSGPCICGSR